MKVTLNWLRQYVDFDWTPEQLTERLTMLGLEVEGVQKHAGAFEGIVVAQVLTRDKVPGSDKLSVCKVHDGRAERQIICGADNHKPGDKVALILPNFALPMKPGDKEPFVIKLRKVFGFESQGMMCSPQELGLPDKIDGLLILREDARVGQPFAEYLGRPGADVVYDLEITPNRPDLNSVIGIAREIAAVTGNPLRLPAAVLPQGSAETADLVGVRLDAPDLGPRYAARVIRGVKIGPSPDWLRSILEKVGLRSINNVVDVTNYVMLETGQPLHAFDYHLIDKDPSGKPTIIVRRAAPGERFTTLDGQERELTSEMLLIADSRKAIALAGVMGGLNTEIRDQTVDVLLESAYFLPANIRRTSKTLGLRTDASYRFERGADPGATEDASRRAAALILETAGGSVANGVVDVRPHAAPPREILLRHRKVNELLGISLSPEAMESSLSRLGLHVAAPKVSAAEDATVVEPVTIRIPSYRVDLKQEVDLIEEIARLHGVDKIPATPPRGAVGRHPFDAKHDQFGEVREILAGLGLNEAQGQTLIAEKSARLFVDEAALVRLANPLSSDMNVLRPSLLPGLLDSLRQNISRKNVDVQLFEVGRVFRLKDGRVSEGWRIAAAMTGSRCPTFWSGADRGAKCDIFDMKGVAEEFLDRFGFRGLVYLRRPQATSAFHESAGITLGGKFELGQLGMLAPAVARDHDLRDPVFMLELDLDELIARRATTRSFKAMPQFPSVRRDAAMVVAESVTHDAVLGCVRQAKAPNIESVEVFDVFRGGNVPEGHKSVAYAFTYRASDKTLTDAEVNATHARVLDALKQGVQAVLRE